MVGALLASLVLLVIARFFASGSAIVPSRGQSLVELPIEFLAGIVRGTGGKRWRQFAPLIFAIFLFVLTANWMSLLPGVGTIGLAKQASDGTKIIVPFVRAGAADLNFTLGLALISFVSFIAFGLRANGVRGYLKELLIAEPALHDAAPHADPPHQRAVAGDQPLDAALRQRLRRRGAAGHDAGAHHGDRLHAAAGVRRSRASSSASSCSSGWCRRSSSRCSP